MKEIIHLKPSTAEQDDDAGDEGRENRTTDAEPEYHILRKAGIVAIDKMLEESQHADGRECHG